MIDFGGLLLLSLAFRMFFVLVDRAVTIFILSAQITGEMVLFTGLHFCTIAHVQRVVVARHFPAVKRRLFRKTVNVLTLVQVLAVAIQHKGISFGRFVTERPALLVQAGRGNTLSGADIAGAHCAVEQAEKHGFEDIVDGAAR